MDLMNTLFFCHLQLSVILKLRFVLLQRFQHYCFRPVTSLHLACIYLFAICVLFVVFYPVSQKNGTLNSCR